MTDQELAEAIYRRFDLEDADNNDIADQVRELLEANPPWEPKQGDPCWHSNAVEAKARVRFHDSSGRWDDGDGRVRVWYEDHRYAVVQSVRLSRLSPREVGE